MYFLVVALYNTSAPVSLYPLIENFANFPHGLVLLIGKGTGVNIQGRHHGAVTDRPAPLKTGSKKSGNRGKKPDIMKGPKQRY
jgi:hypothetical protein